MTEYTHKEYPYCNTCREFKAHISTLGGKKAIYPFAPRCRAKGYPPNSYTVVGHIKAIGYLGYHKGRGIKEIGF